MPLILCPRRCLRLIIWISIWFIFLLIYQSIRELLPKTGETSNLQELGEDPPNFDAQSRGERSANRPFSYGSNSRRLQYPKLLGKQYFAPYIIDADKTVVVYSAFIDFRRGNMGPAPAVRFMALAKTRDQRLSLRCRFRLPNVQATYEVTRYETPEPHGAVYAAYVLSCVIPSNVPDPVGQLTEVELCDASDLKIPCVTIPISGYVDDVPNSTIANHRHQHSICVPTLFGGRYTSRHLIEFIEAHTVLGIDYFFFYVYDKDFDQYEKVLEYYRGRGRLTYFKLTLLIDAASWSVWNYAQSLVVQDCVFRNAGYTRYLLLNDLDEYFVPYAADTWPQLSSSVLWKETNRAGYAVPTFYFPPQNRDGRSEEDDHEKKEADQESLPSPPFPPAPVTLNHMRATATADTWLTKCIIRPERVFDQGIHHVSRVIQDYYLISKINTSIAALHHFKDPLRAESAIGEATANRTRLKDLMKRGGRLMKGYARVVKSLGV